MPRIPSWARAVAIVMLVLLPLRGMTQVLMSWVDVGTDARGASALATTAPSCHGPAVSADAPPVAGHDGHAGPGTSATPTDADLGVPTAAAHGNGFVHANCMLCDLCHAVALPAWLAPGDTRSASLPCPSADDAGAVQHQPPALDKPPRR